MRIVLLILAIFSKANLFSQEFTIHYDTANHFSIGIPDGWIVEKKAKKDHVVLSVRLNKTDEAGIIPSFLVNLIESKNITFDKFYSSYCRPLDSKAEDNTLIREGNFFANGINYKWILTKKKTVEIRTLAYYCYKNGIIYQLSFTTDLTNYLKYEYIFKKVITTFRI